MTEEQGMKGVRIIDAGTRVEGLRLAFRMAAQALDRGLYDSLSVISPNRQLSFGYDLGRTRGSISLFAATDRTPLNEWLLDWRMVKTSLGRLCEKGPAANVSLSLGESVGRSEWHGDDLLQAMFERGDSTLHIWDLGGDECVFLPRISDEAARRGISVLVVRTGGSVPWRNGDIMPNLEDISVHERCLALIRTAGKISRSMIQWTFRLSWVDADRLMRRLETDGIIKESTEGDVPYEVVWGMVPKGPSLSGRPADEGRFLCQIG